MALIDMLTDIKSFNYKSVGEKQGEYFGEKNATGFTTNRNTKDESEFTNKESIFSPKGVDFFNNENATGFTLNRKQKDLPEGEYIANSGGIYNFKSKLNSRPNFTINRSEGDETEYLIGSNPQQSMIKGVDFFTNRNRDGFIFDATVDFDAAKKSLYKIGSGNPDYDFTVKRGFSFFPTDRPKGFTIDTNPGDRFKGGDVPDTEFPTRGTFNTLKGVDYFSNTYQDGFIFDATVAQDAAKRSFYKGISPDGLTFDSSTVFYGNISTTDFFSDTHGVGFELNAGELYPVGQLGEGGRSGFKLEKLFEGKNPEPSSEKFTSEYSRVLTARTDVVEIGTTGVDATFGGKYTKTSSPNLPSLSSNDFIDHKYGTPAFPALALQDRLAEIDSQYSKFGGNAGLRGGNSDNPGDGNSFSEQPFIIKNIGDNSYSDSFDEGIFRGGIVLQGKRTLDDLERIGKFLTSPKGLLFVGKQFLLQFGVEALGVEGNQFKKANVFNPLGSLGSIVPLVHLPRHTNPFSLGLDVARPPKYQNHEPESGYGNYDQNEGKESPDKKSFFSKVKDGVLDAAGLYKPNTPVQSSDVAAPRPGFMSNLRDSLPGVEAGNEADAEDFGLGLGKIKKGRGLTGKVYEVGTSNMLQVPYGGKFGDLRRSAQKLPKDFIKFRIRDAVNGKWIIFPAHMGTITDTVTPEYAKERYIGRPDEVHIYTGTSRAVAFDFKVAAFTKQEVPIIQQKMNALVGLGYPSFKPHIQGENTQRMVTPYIYLTIGDLFNNTPGYFDNITVTFEENVVWEVQEGMQIPHYFQVSVNFVYIGKTLPNTIGKHYDVPFMKDVGIGKNKFGVFGKEDPRDGKTDRPDYPKASKLFGFGGDKLHNLMKKEAQVP